MHGVLPLLDTQHVKNWLEQISKMSFIRRYGRPMRSSWTFTWFLGEQFSSLINRSVLILGTVGRHGELFLSLVYIVSLDRHQTIGIGAYICKLASYDYGSSIMENRMLTPKFTELKRQGMFLRSSPEFYKTEWVGNSSSGAVNVSNPDAFVVLLSNPDSGSNFYIARQTDSTST